MQRRGASLGDAFGGQEVGHYSRRGPERKLYLITIILGFLFILLALLNVVLA
jgi:protein translocase SecG subunit